MGQCVMARGVPGSRQVFEFTCETCGTVHTSHKEGRRFCSVKCRAQSPDFKDVARANAKKAQKGRRRQKTQETRSCDFCSRPFDCQPASDQRFCNRRCYRGWRATIFDNYIAALADVPELSNFDEFLNRNVLECPIKGCSWQGEDLGQHVAFGHGIPAAVFKRRAGFNKHTGLVGQNLAHRLQERDIPRTEFTNRGKGPRTGQRLRKEGRENHQKAMALRHAQRQTKPKG